MRAVWFDSFGATPQLREVAEPHCPDTGVVIEVEATGLCRSDWHGWTGHDPDIALPHVPGHEFAGTVVAAGTEVTRELIGRRVTVPFVCACGTCPSCAADEQQVCIHQTQPGFTGWGSFAERVAIEHADVNVVELPGALDFDTAASLGCRFATAYRAVRVHARPAPGQTVAVHGCGGVGLSAVMIAAATGAEVIAVDIAPEALRLAREFGATHVIDARETSDVAGRIRDLTGGGAHASLDALGSTATAVNSIGCLRPRGRHVQVGLLTGPDADPALPIGRVLSAELEILGSHGMPAHAYPAMLAEIAAGTLQPQRLITGHITLDDTPAALAAMADSSPIGITVVHPRESLS
jgi:D-arabinose 1-dehydrogenase-like Zn-dependent alcohol dehydrogenase